MLIIQLRCLFNRNYLRELLMKYQVDRLALVLVLSKVNCYWSFHIIGSMSIDFASAIQRMQLLHFGKYNKDNNQSQQYKQSDNKIQKPDKI